MHFFGRYVDDIVIVARTANDRDATEVKLGQAVASLGLTLNAGKTQKLDPVPVAAGSSDPYDISGPFDFLGYAISKLSGAVAVEMSTRSVDRYKARLKATFDQWAATSSPTSGHEGLLLDRVRFLAGNTKLVNSKGRAVTGIYFNYPQLTAGAASLAILDTELAALISAHAAPMQPSLLNRLNSASFVRGFAERTYHRFQQSDLERLVAVWRE